MTPKGYLLEEQAMTYLADTDPDSALAPLQSAACTYRIALGPGRAKGAGGVVVMAKQLRVSKPTLYRRLKRYNISADNAGGPSFSMKSAVFPLEKTKLWSLVKEIAKLESLWCLPCDLTTYEQVLIVMFRFGA